MKTGTQEAESGSARKPFKDYFDQDAAKALAVPIVVAGAALLV